MYLTLSPFVKTAAYWIFKIKMQERRTNNHSKLNKMNLLSFASLL